MSFENFTSIDQVAKKYHLTLRQEEPFHYADILPRQPHDYLKNLLEFELHHQPRKIPEYALCESLIYPLLRETWMRHPTVQLWSHLTLEIDEDLAGVPDYLVAKKSEQGLGEIDVPLLTVVEAKREDFWAGWGQCLAQMVALQKFNVGLAPMPVIYGVVTTGRIWEFGQLEGNQFKTHPLGLSLTQTDVLLGVLDYLWSQCEAQLAKIMKNDGG